MKELSWVKLRVMTDPEKLRDPGVRVFARGV
jgi:hypothetical protein